MRMTGRLWLAPVVWLTFLSIGRTTELRAETLDALLDSAATDSVYYGQPARIDSLVRMISAWPPDSLIERLDTPWAAYYDILRRALVQSGSPARRAIIGHLRRSGAGRDILTLLPVFEELGRKGDDRRLFPLLRSENAAWQIGACRCLARFGQPSAAWKTLVPLLESRTLHVRLAAAWCVGEILRSEPGARCPEKVRRVLRARLNDPLPQVRFSASEAFRLAEPEAAGELPVPLVTGP